MFVGAAAHLKSLTFRGANGQSYHVRLSEKGLCWSTLSVAAISPYRPCLAPKKAAEGMKFGMGLCLKALPEGSFEGRSEGFRDPLPLKIRFA